MFLNKAYYLLKPIIPWKLRTALRRTRAKSKLAHSGGVWPIDPKAGTTPPNWPGWPHGKQFGFVLSHDVEGTKGLQRVEKLMELESKYGFRSSFNFVPEGEYRVSDELRARIESKGFEVGIHGLEHDGKLYSSKASFALKAAQIRKYAAKWDAAGFRSPLMQHKLAWLHELGTEYDASTFDTDPFEPEPDGAGTIFPFWVPHPNGGGYVELPYTLVQDFNLFTVLREPNIDIWKRKLDWVAEHGGMALLNTHPDYMSFDRNLERDEYPVSHYEEFLAYAQDKYGSVLWPALPREVARSYCASIPQPSRNSRKKICMITHSNYEGDNRVRRYAEALAQRGDYVEVIAIARETVPLGSEEINGVTVHRLHYRERNERGKWDYAWRLLRFFVTCSMFLTRRHHRVRYDFIHVHNVPDFLVFAAWYPKLTGVKIILDIHDIVPEFFASKFGSKPGSRYIQLLKSVEKASASFSDHVIVSNHLWQETLVSRSVAKDKCSVYLNHVDPFLFYQRQRTRTDGKKIILFHGTFNWHQGLDIAVEAFAHVKKELPEAEFHIYGGGKSEDLKQIADQLGVGDSVKFCGSVSLDKIPDVVANADVGVVPKRANSFGNQAYSTKIMEFMSQGVPAVVSRTQIDSFYFNDKVVRFFDSGDSRAMADAVLEVLKNQELRNELIQGGLEYVRRNGWGTRRREYLALVDSLSTEVFADAGTDQPVRERGVAQVPGVAVVDSAILQETTGKLTD